VNWNDEITPNKGVTLNEWTVRETTRLVRWMDYYWDAIDGGNELSVTKELIEKYNEVCDRLDQMESDPYELFVSM
jgi:hypothetical protein